MRAKNSQKYFNTITQLTQANVKRYFSNLLWGKYNYNLRKYWRELCIESNDNIVISNKQTVKYIGVNLDKFLYFNKHIDSQIQKAKKTFLRKSENYSI